MTDADKAQYQKLADQVNGEVEAEPEIDDDDDDIFERARRKYGIVLDSDDEA